MERELGYCQALQEAGLPVNKANVCHVEFDMSNLGEKVKRLLAAENAPSALLVTNNRLAIGVLSMLKELQLEVPDDVALVVFDDLELFELHTPSNSAVAQPAYAMGYKAAGLLLEQLTKDSPPPIQVITFHPELIVRKSSQLYRQQPISENLPSSEG